MLNIAWEMGVAIALIAFAAEYVDSTLGMGYGTSLMPILLLFGFEPLQIVPSILLSELVSGLFAGVMHHRAGNVHLKPKTTNVRRILSRLREKGLVVCIRKGMPSHLKIATVLASLSIVGTVAAVFVAVSLPKFYLKLYIGVLVLSMGIIILSTMNGRFGFSWWKIAILGLVAAFNKGMSGGGYGPVVTGGQLLAGVEGKNAVGITSLAEGLTCAVGLAAYLLVKGVDEWNLAPFILVGAVLSVPLSAHTVSKVGIRKLEMVIGVVTVFLGGATLVKLFI